MQLDAVLQQKIDHPEAEMADFSRQVVSLVVKLLDSKSCIR